MSFYTAHAIHLGNDKIDNAQRAVATIHRSFTGRDLRGIAFFSAPDYDPAALAAGFHQSFPGVKTFGCTSAGEFADGTMLSNSVSAMAFSPEDLEVLEVAGMSGIDADPHAASRLFLELERKTGLEMRTLDSSRHVGFLLLDALAAHNDRLVEQATESTRINIAGGLAGDRREYQHTMVMCEGEALENGAVFVLMKPKGKFSAFKTQAVSVINSSLLATRIDAERRIIWEFDNKPAAIAYAEAIGLHLSRNNRNKFKVSGLSPQELYVQLHQKGDSDGNKIDRESVRDEYISEFTRWPLALMINGEPFIRSALTVLDEGGIQTYLPPIEGGRYYVTAASDVVADLRWILEKKQRELGGVSAVLCANCSLRELQIRTSGQCEDYAASFAGIAALGFSSFGEIFKRVVSLSSSMIVFA
ncbi:MAG: hypothetical protein LBU64_13770 [Planctomycetota bacterium]|nr:hypothetical protein [Planctomycetota bacterium]